MKSCLSWCPPCLWSRMSKRLLCSASVWALQQLPHSGADKPLQLDQSVAPLYLLALVLMNPFPIFLHTKSITPAKQLRASMAQKPPLSDLFSCKVGTHRKFTPLATPESCTGNGETNSVPRVTGPQDNRGGTKADLLLHGGAAPHLLPGTLVGPQRRPPRREGESRGIAQHSIA